MLTLTPLLLILPLVGFVILGLFGRAMPRGVIATIGCGVVLLAFIIALGTFFALQGSVRADQMQWTWIASGGLTIPFGLLVDQLAAMMMLVVTGVGFLIHVYSVGYMLEELKHQQEGHSELTEADVRANLARFFSFMNFFVFAMSLLVLANNFLFLLVGWAGVGLASFLLIGFWFTRPAAVAAAQKAFVINVIGDFGLMIAIFLLVGKFNTLNYVGTILGATGQNAPHFAASDMTTTAIALMLLIAAAAKSAQLPLHLWLPDAMEGPTPVSALIHAATMVTAGVYLVARAHVIFENAPYATTVLAVMGGASAVFAATTALFQYDIKRVLAYSTMSQLGYMFMAESVGANSPAIFHLMTHAFFKALLFMAAGGVILALHGEQDLRKMGGLRGVLPVTFWSFVIGGLALAGIAPFAGFWSKDAILGAILTQAQAQGNAGLYLLWGAGILTAFLTGLYSFRLIFAVFFGAPRIADQHPNGVGMTMRVPMLVLLVLAAIGGLIGTPFSNAFGQYLSPAVYTGTRVTEIASPFANAEWLSLIVVLVVSIAGIGLAWVRYGQRPSQFTENKNPFYRTLKNAYYLDLIFNAAIAQPVMALGRGLNSLLEDWILDGGSRGIALIVGQTSKLLRRLQTGYARNYALGIVLGTVVIIGVYLVYSVR